MPPCRGAGLRKAVLAKGIVDWQALKMGLAFLAFARIPRISAELDTKAPGEGWITSFKLLKLFLYFVINSNRIGSHLLIGSAAKYLTRWRGRLLVFKRRHMKNVRTRR